MPCDSAATHCPKSASATLKPCWLLAASIVIACCYFSSATVVPTPSWLQGKRYLLPKVSPKAIAAMEKAWPELAYPSDAPGWTPPPSYWDAVRTVKNLGDQAVLALIWVYAQDISDSKQNDLNALDHKGDLISSSFLRDSTSHPWVLPLLRERLNWIERNLDRGALDGILVSASEVGHIEGYMNGRGTGQDLERSHNLMRKLAESGSHLGRSIKQFMPSEDAVEIEANKFRRESIQKHIEPYHYQFNRVEANLCDAGAMTPPIGVKGGKSPAALNPAPTQEGETIDHGTGSKATASNPFALNVIVVAWVIASGTGIVVLLLIQRKRPRF